jgi:hypothetical protein
MKRAPQRPWTADEDAMLRHLYPTTSAGVIGRQLGRTRPAVKNRVHALGLAKSENPGRFRKGQVSWNKGTHFVSGGRSIATRFKKGQKPHTWQPIGHTRIRSDGYMERKTADTGCTRRDYQLIHHLVWRMHDRSIPRGEVLVFIDGCRTNADINNLELVTRIELMRRNTIHNYPKEIAQLVQLRSAVSRQINRRERATP